MSEESIQGIDVSGNVVRALKPGVAGLPVGAFDNPNDFPVEVHAVDISTSGIVGAPGPCTAADFEVEDAVAPTSPESARWIVLAGGTKSWKGGAITLINDEAHDPSGCLGASLSLNFEVTRPS